MQILLKQLIRGAEITLSEVRFHRLTTGRFRHGPLAGWREAV